jgi:hypothetical protein
VTPGAAEGALNNVVVVLDLPELCEAIVLFLVARVVQRADTGLSQYLGITGIKHVADRNPIWQSL